MHINIYEIASCACLRVSLFISFSRSLLNLSFFFFNDTATTEIYTLSLHDALPISRGFGVETVAVFSATGAGALAICSRSEEHTSELQSHLNLVCRLLLEKKKIGSKST